MKYVSTRAPSERVGLEEAVVKSLPAAGGLYVPASWPGPISALSPQALPGLSPEELGAELLGPFLSERFSPTQVADLVKAAFTFDAPLAPWGADRGILELWHGPTFAFKDFGARFMAQVMGRFQAGRDRELHVLVATSGDTGAAAAAGFYGVEGVRVWVLFPKGRVSPMQELQLTTLGGNVQALEVDDNFDACQRLVKQAFSDRDLARELRLTSANSINVARLLPQMWYYARALQQVDRPRKDIRFVVPSGNFGNLCAGMWADALGLGVHGFLAATNVNGQGVLDRDPDVARSSVPTWSNAMDVAQPSNLQRIFWLVPDPDALAEHLSAVAVSDEETLESMRQAFRLGQVLLDPHTAVGYRASTKVSGPGLDIILGTAHPAKFEEAVWAALRTEVRGPPGLRELETRPRHSTPIPSSYPVLRDLLWSTR